MVLDKTAIQNLSYPCLMKPTSIYLKPGMLKILTSLRSIRSGYNVLLLHGFHITGILKNPVTSKSIPLCIFIISAACISFLDQYTCAIKVRDISN
jgi:hypothetical protein